MAKSFVATLVLALMALPSEAFFGTKSMMSPPSKAPPAPKPALRMPKYDFTDDKFLEQVFDNNKKWAEAKKAADPTFFSNFEAGQAPPILWIGCSDSRAPPNTIMGLEVGDVFVTRNVANCVNPGMDNSLMSVVQYGITALMCSHIVVCGHYGCGGVAASMENTDHTPPLEQWLVQIRDTQRIHAEELRRISDKDERTKRLVELNVVEQCMNLFKTGVVQKRLTETYKNPEYPFSLPRIHPVVYDPATGYLKELDVDFSTKIKQLGDIYTMYFPEEQE
mmetsp:Transcript_52695/g.120083  ORF Transcript_52695/g.120083 Transcript_52695/m.120083 type:complete len:278 (+) Transcript_52695:53-886(+)